MQKESASYCRRGHTRKITASEERSNAEIHGAGEHKGMAWLEGTVQSVLGKGIP